MSRFSEKRMAEDFVRLLDSRTPGRRRSDFLIILATLAAGLIGNFVFNKIEIAAVLWTVTLLCIADLLLTIGELSEIRGFPRFLTDTVIVAIAWWLSFPLVYSLYRAQHAALTTGVLQTPSDGKDHSQDMPRIQIGDGLSIIRSTTPTMNFVKSGHDHLVIRREGNHLLVSTTIRDQLGKLILEVTDNHWRVSDSSTECWDKNYTNNALVPVS